MAEILDVKQGPLSKEPKLSVFHGTVVLNLFCFVSFAAERLGYVTLLLLLYGWAVIPLIYLLSFLFTVPSTAFIRLTIFNVITGLATLLTVFILSIPALELLDVAKVLKWAFLFLPNYALGQALNDIFTNHQYIDIFNQAMKMCQTKLSKSFCEQIVKLYFKNSPNQIVFQTNYLAWEAPGIGRYLVFLAWEGLVFFLLVLLIDYQHFSTLCTIFKRKNTISNLDIENGVAVPADDDVATEMRRIDAKDNTYKDVLLLDNVSKTYGKFGKSHHLTVICGLCPSPVNSVQNFLAGMQATQHVIFI